MNVEERFELIKRNTLEIITEEDLRTLLNEKKSPSVYIGRATTGPLHLGHLIAIGKLFDFMNAGVEVKILLADVHAALDDLKAKWEELDKRVEYTRKCIELAFDWGDRKPVFVKGSDYQLNRDYLLDMLKMSTITTVERATRAASEVTRMKNPKVSELIYPIMQALDEQYLDVDIQLGGNDQRHIFVFDRDYLPQLGYRKRVEVMTPLVASLLGPGTKMSSSVPSSHIKVYDSEENLRKKINSAYCPEGVVKDNLVLQMVKFLVFPMDGKFEVSRPQKFGGDAVFESYADMEKAFTDKKLHPADLKKALAEYLVARLAPAREYFEKHRDVLEELGPEFLP